MEIIDKEIYNINRRVQTLKEIVNDFSNQSFTTHKILYVFNHNIYIIRE